MKTMVVRIAISCLVALCAVTAWPQNNAAPKPPGQLIDMGGYKLHLSCTGAGNPTVVMSSGAGDFSLDWALVQPKVAEFTRVCTYDRAGEAWSDLGPQPATRKQEAYDLHRLLLKAGIAGPYLMVGHSLGGLLVQAFAMDYPTDVAGMVLLDSTHPNSIYNINGKVARAPDFSQGRPMPAPRAGLIASDALTPENLKGILDFLKKFDIQPNIEPPYDKLPAETQKLRIWALSQPRHWAALQNEYFGEESQAINNWELKTEYPFGDLPLAVLSRPTPENAKKLDKDHEVRQVELAHLSRRGKLQYVPNSSHHIQLDNPVAVVAAVKQMVGEMNESARKLEQ